MKTILLLLALILLGVNPAMALVESPEYEVIKSDKNIEIRQYKPYLIAEVSTSGKRNEAANEGFFILFDYISGKNTPREKIKMAAPVEQKGQKIPMTAPVEQSKDNDEWKLSFVIPSKYNLENVPQPKDSRINIYQHESSKRAVIRFSGFWTESNLNKHKEKLEKYIQENGLNIKSEVIYAFYNSPYWIPFFRRNEVMYIVE